MSGHQALLYEEPTRLVAVTAAFVRREVAGGAAVLLALTADKAGWLREELGSHFNAVDHVDAGKLYAGHGPMFSRVLAYLARNRARGRGRVAVVAEQPQPLRCDSDARAYMRYEAAANVVYPRFGAAVLCPYDVRRATDAVLADVARTHPLLVGRRGLTASPDYADPARFVRSRVALEPLPPEAVSHGFDTLRDVPEMRRRAELHAGDAGLAAGRVEDLGLAVTEVVTNALLHGRGPRHMWLYRTDGAVVCRVCDSGPGLADPLVGYLPPDFEQQGGRGVWIAHQACDVVEVRSGSSATEVCLRMYL